MLFLIYIFCYLSSRFNVLAIFFWFSCWFILYASQRQRLCIATLNFFCVVRFWLAVDVEVVVVCCCIAVLSSLVVFTVSDKNYQVNVNASSENCLSLVMGSYRRAVFFILLRCFFRFGLYVVAAASCRS